MVLFGSLESRKGLFQTLDALGRMPQEHAARLAVAFVGPIYDGIRDVFLPRPLLRPRRVRRWL